MRMRYLTWKRGDVDECSYTSISIDLNVFEEFLGADDLRELCSAIDGPDLGNWCVYNKIFGLLSGDHHIGRGEKLFFLSVVPCSFGVLWM